MTMSPAWLHTTPVGIERWKVLRTGAEQGTLARKGGSGFILGQALSRQLSHSQKLHPFFYEG